MRRVNKLLPTGRVLLAALALLAAAGTVRADPLTLTMVIDELTHGRAVLQGDLLGAFVGIPEPPDPRIPISRTLNAVRPDGSPPVHWTVSLVLQRQISGNLALIYSIDDVVGRHISDPPPHEGEASPGPRLRIGVYFDLDAVTSIGPPAPLVRSISLEHDNPTHYDVMTTTLFDLNPNARTVLGVNEEVRMRVDLEHTPEPATLLLLGTGLAGVAAMVRRRRKVGSDD